MSCPDSPAKVTSFFDVEAAMKSLLFMNGLRKQATLQTNSQQQEKQLDPSCSLCDVTVQVNGRQLPAHKVVLASCSEYFARVLTTGPQAVASTGDRAAGNAATEHNTSTGVVDVTSQLSEAERIEDAAFDALLDYAYTKRVDICEANVHDIFHAADCLRFSGVKIACFKFLERALYKDNCIGMWMFAKGHSDAARLVDASRRVVEANFKALCSTFGFLELPLESVVELLSSDNLNVSNEEEVYKAAVDWLHHGVHDERRSNAASIMGAVRLELLSHEFLMSILDTDSLITDDCKCLAQAIAAIEIKVEHQDKVPSSSAVLDEAGTTHGRRSCHGIEEICIPRQSGGRLGVGVMGGVDRPGHVFYKGSSPCLRVTEIHSDGAASNSNVRAGDQILSINGHPAEHLRHDQAIALLSKPRDRITLVVRHEPPPPGLQQFNLSSNRGQGFGLCIEGGANAPSGNPEDPDDDGIYVSQILPGGAAEHSGMLKVGHRILQANSISMLGISHAEALQILRQSAERLHLMVCDGFKSALVPPVGDSAESRRQQVSEHYRKLCFNIPEYANTVPY
eukprot:scpid44761/ scgid12187/ Protein scribble homolog; Protein LAP4